MEEDALWTYLALHRYDELDNGLLALFKMPYALDTNWMTGFSSGTRTRIDPRLLRLAAPGL